MKKEHSILIVILVALTVAAGILLYKEIEKKNGNAVVDVETGDSSIEESDYVYTEFVKGIVDEKVQTVVFPSDDNSSIKTDIDIPSMLIQESTTEEVLGNGEVFYGLDYTQLTKSILLEKVREDRSRTYIVKYVSLEEYKAELELPLEVSIDSSIEFFSASCDGSTPDVCTIYVRK